MVGFVKAKDYAGYVTAAGLLAHYVGDACQPLHGSVLADGFQDQAVVTTTSTGKPKKLWPGKGVHSAYETKMINRKALALFKKIDAELTKAADPCSRRSSQGTPPQWRPSSSWPTWPGSCRRKTFAMPT